MKRKQLLLPALLLVALAYAFYVYWPLIGQLLPGQRTAAVKPAPVTQVVPTTAVSNEAPVAAASPEAGTAKVATKEVMADPFVLRIAVTPKRTKTAETKPAGTAEVKVVQPELAGIWVDANMKVAFISGQTLVEGGQIMGWRVARIEKSYVMLTKGNKQKILKVEVLQ